ncbi:MAG: ribbon-helix-helix domain-containing protein [Candidatus Woesearchaeota archaeon]
MANPLVSVRVTKAMQKDCETISETLGYTSTQEFIRDAIREKILAIKRDIAMEEIRKIPLQKGTKATKNELEAYAKKLYS